MDRDTQDERNTDSPERTAEHDQEQEQRTRRAAHTKSRSGCLRCKKRRVKCNEGRPKCRACELRGETCRYPAVKVCNNCNRLACVCVGDYIPRVSTLEDWTDFECTFHWARFTCDTILEEPLHKAARPLLQPPACLGHPFLMDLFLALSSAHLAILNPSRAKTCDIRAIHYQNRALSGFNAVLRDPKPDDLLPMFAFSAILGILEVGLSRTAGSEKKPSIVEGLCGLTRLFRGSQFIMRQMQDTIPSDVYDSIFRDEDAKVRRAHLEMADDDFSMPDDEPLDEMLAEIDEYLPGRATSGEGYQDAVIMLRRITAIHGPKRPVQLLSWPALWKDGFLNQIQEGDTRCEALLACYGLTMRRVNEKWWAKSYGRDLVLELASGSSSAILGPFYARILELIG